MALSPAVLDYISSHGQEYLDLLLTLARIPAPSNQEGKRATFCKAWLVEHGAQGVFIDPALNVVWPIGETESNPLVVYMAHSDVVFPDTAPLPLSVSGGRIYCPGIGDDTTNVAALLMTARYLAEQKLQPRDCGVLLVINAGEEGLGNLKGSRKIMEVYGNRIREFITFDDKNCMGVNRAVGSRRYRVAIDTEGGHSFTNFGNRNAIAYLSSLINTLYEIKVPDMGRTTYNVGTISGGTSVNTIAQHAEMLYEFRSDEGSALDYMEDHFRAAVSFFRTKGIQVNVTSVGDRPCGIAIDPEQEAALMARASAAVELAFGKPVTYQAGSTDCNIPLSMGIPAVCVGCYRGDGAHTREEYVELDSLLPGLQVAFDMILHHF